VEESLLMDHMPSYQLSLTQSCIQVSQKNAALSPTSEQQNHLQFMHFSFKYFCTDTDNEKLDDTLHFIGTAG
jgi:hypothetical protein